jgi:bifunctional DNA-binding transcriptional regulator/antitoxin component of YhaV-PrlF toxin-antitoxin module
MTITLKAKAPLVVPPSVQRKARLKAGDQVEFRATPGKITIVTKPPVAAATAADDEYTPEQRRIIEAQLAEGLEDIKKGRTYGPFNTVEEMIASMEANIKKSRPAKKRKHGR